MIKNSPCGTTRVILEIKKNQDKTPHFLWNATMCFGKTFAAYQLAGKTGGRRYWY
jgi:hypothetical protein